MNADLQKDIDAAFESIGFRDASLFSVSEVEITWDPPNPDIPGDTAKNFSVHHFEETARGVGSPKEVASAHGPNMSSGASFTDWMKKSEKTPEAVMLYLIQYQYMPRDEELKKMLLEFSKIGECHWARVMAADMIHTGGY